MVPTYRGGGKIFRHVTNNAYNHYYPVLGGNGSNVGSNGTENFAPYVSAPLAVRNQR